MISFFIMGRNRKANILGITITINGKSMYIDFRSKNSIEMAIKINENKINDILNQIHPSNNDESSNAIKGNERDEFLQLDTFASFDDCFDTFLDDLNNDFFNDPNLDSTEPENISYY